MCDFTTYRVDGSLNLSLRHSCKSPSFFIGKSHPNLNPAFIKPESPSGFEIYPVLRFIGLALLHIPFKFHIKDFTAQLQICNR